MGLPRDARQTWMGLQYKHLYDYLGLLSEFYMWESHGRTSIREPFFIVSIDGVTMKGPQNDVDTVPTLKTAVR